jgi:cytochrome P450
MGVVGATLFGADTFDKADELGEALTVALKWVDDALATPQLALQISLIEAFEAIEPHVPSRFAELRAKIDEAVHTPHLLPGRKGEEFQKAIRTLDTVMNGMIAERRAHPRAGVDLLTKLLLARDTEGGRSEGMSDAQVRDEANTLFVAGHETTANALAWCFYLLARNPEAKAKVQAEADAFGPEGPTTWAPDALAYTSRVFKEALRLYPPLVVLVRRSLEPFEVGGETYPRHTIVAVNPYGIHMNPRVWEDPDRFDPDRFTPEREATRHKSAWIPFGVGPRVCIGNHFALMEGPIVLATLMRNARFEIDAGRTIAAETFATLRPKGGVPAVVRRRGD